MKEIKGIDVSYAQGSIDFSRINKEQVGFAIVRSSYGWMPGQKDDQFDRNIRGFSKKGIPCGAYHYSYATSIEDAVKEAEYCLECIGDAKLALPIFLDMEDAVVAACGKRICTDIAKTFCEHIQKAGHQAGIYTNPNWLYNYIYKDELLGKYNIWLAQWGSRKPSFDCMIWQYNVGKNGCIDGIGGECDLDIMYVKEAVQNDNKTDQKSDEVLQVGDRVQILDPVIYGTDRKFTVYPEQDYSIIEINGRRAVIGINGQVTAAIDTKYLKKITDKDKQKVRTYIVQTGDTLSGIAAAFNTTVRKLVAENGIRNPDLIYAGQKLKI